MSKPKICEILGVDVGQRFTVKGYLEPVKAFWITEDGLFETEPANLPGSTVALLKAIENPEIVVKQPKFTADEMAVLRMMKRAGITGIKRWDGDNLRIVDTRFLLEERMVVDLLPSLEHGIVLDLDKMDLQEKPDSEEASSG